MKISRRELGSLGLGGALGAAVPVRAAAKTPWQDPARSPEDRAADLAAAMTLPEHIAQLLCLPADDVFRNPKALSSADSPLSHGIGSVFRASKDLGPKGNTESVELLQSLAVKTSRFGVPALIFEECLHGYVGQGATVFPQAIGMSCSWDTALVEAVYSAVAMEARARGANMCFSPNLDICHDPRWGRSEETWGEDPFLVSIFAEQIVSGLQGKADGYLKPDKIGAVAKHFAGYGQALGGRNFAPVNIGRRQLMNTAIPPFERVIKSHRLMGVMAAHGEIDGVPSHVDKWLLEDILRRKLGFDGFIVSDYDDVRRLHTLHRVAENEADAAVRALDAGVDMELAANGVYPKLLARVDAGGVTKEAIAKAAERILVAKFRAGLFDRPFTDARKAVGVSRSAKHRSIARKMAEKSIVLLKNDDATLPLRAGEIKRLLVVGPNADELHFGGYSPKPFVGTTVLEGLTQKFRGKNVDIRFAQGCFITAGPDQSGELEIDKTKNIPLADPEANKVLIAKAVEMAKDCDAIIMVLGGNENTERESYFQGDSRGERDSVELAGDQNLLASELLKLAKPTVAVLIHGRPLGAQYLAGNCPAILDAWYPGEEGGHAVADILFGDVNPSAKLTVSLPRNVGQLPVYYNQQPTGWFRKYAFVENGPLYPFGFGLSYTQYKYGAVSASAPTLARDGKLRVTVDVTNVGKMDGDEIVQLYIRDMISADARPVLELRAFRKLSIKAGKTETAVFDLDASDFSYFNGKLERETEAGEYMIAVGPSSAELQQVPIRLD
jgi:beta-glucosidase